MSTSGHAFINLADAHMGGANSEDEYRCVVNRSYYGAYHTSKIWHDGLDKPGIHAPSGTGMHEDFLHQLRYPTTDDADKKTLSKEIEYQLKGLKFQRTQADYKLEAVVTGNDANTALARAKQIVSVL
jgi:uncharacterized protein (UPF0332 family)